MQEQTFKREDIKISDDLYKKILIHWNKAPEKSTLIHPEEAKHSPLFVMSEILTNVLKVLYPNPKLASSYFSELYPMTLKGRNPFEDKDLKKAGVDPEYFRFVLGSMTNA